MRRIGIFYLLVVISFLFLSCSEEDKIPNGRKRFDDHNDLFSQKRKTYVIPSNILYEFDIGNLSILLKREELYNVNFYSRTDNDSKNVRVYLKQSLDVSDMFYIDDLETKSFDGINFNTTVLTEIEYNRKFETAGIDSLEIEFYEEEQHRKMVLDLLNKDDDNEKFKFTSARANVSEDVVDGLNIRWFYKKDDFNNVPQYTIYLETKIPNIDPKNEEQRDENSLEEALDERVVSITYSAAFCGSFNEKNKDKLIREFIETLKERKLLVTK